MFSLGTINLSWHHFFACSEKQSLACLSSKCFVAGKLRLVRWLYGEYGKDYTWLRFGHPQSYCINSSISSPPASIGRGVIAPEKHSEKKDSSEFRSDLFHLRFDPICPSKIRSDFSLSRRFQKSGVVWLTRVHSFASMIGVAMSIMWRHPEGPVLCWPLLHWVFLGELKKMGIFPKHSKLWCFLARKSPICIIPGKMGMVCLLFSLC